MFLADLTCGASATIRGLDAADEPDLLVGLMELGLVPGTKLTLIRAAPLGCPLEVEVAGARLAIRRDVAESIEVEAS